MLYSDIIINIILTIMEKYFQLFIDFQKLEREARICRKLQHPNIGKKSSYNIHLWYVKSYDNISNELIENQILGSIKGESI